MKYNGYNSGELRAGRKRGNRFVTSSLIDDPQTSSIAIIIAILALAIITCIFFAVFADELSVPAWNSDSTTSTKKPDTGSVDKIYPYATVTDKTSFVASKNKANAADLGDLWLNSEYAILVNTSDMTTVGYKNADDAIYPASMTKVMTVITALDYIEDLDDIYVVTQEVLDTVPEQSSVASLQYLLNEYGVNKLTVRDLLYGISYMSGADAVLCLMDYLGLTVNEFVDLMNEKAREIGLESTRFGGAIGMDAEENRTTCRDMAAIMTYAMENEYARELFSGGRHQFDVIEGYSYYHSTLDTLLDRMGTGADLLLGNYTVLAAKSGLEDKAGYCLVSYIQNDKTGECFVLVTAKAEKYDSWTPAANPIYDMVEIFDELKP